MKMGWRREAIENEMKRVSEKAEVWQRKREGGGGERGRGKARGEKKAKESKRGGRKEERRRDKEESETRVCLFVWFLNVLVNN